MRLGTCLLPEGITLQGARPKMAGFYSAAVVGFYAAVDIPTAALVGMGSKPPFAFAETLDGAPAAKPSLVFRL